MNDGDHSLRWHGPGIVTLREDVMAPNGRMYTCFFSKLWRAAPTEELGLDVWTGRSPSAPPRPIFVALTANGAGSMFVDPDLFLAHVLCDRAPPDEDGLCYDLSSPVPPEQ